MDETRKMEIKVLLIDDDEDEYVITRDFFADMGEGFRLFWSDTFEKGMEEIVKNQYSICLLDFHLGARNGIDFLAEAVAKNCSIPIILLTGQGDYEVDLAAMKAGASDYLDKRQLSASVLERSIRYALERKKTEEKIRFLAFFDQLTHLPNRTLFLDRLKTAFASARRHRRLCAVMFLDIDNFKRINDTLGHSLGDRLIQEVGRRLLKCIRKEDTVAHDNFSGMLDTVARLGGDEFTILLNEIREPANASIVAERIRHVLRAPVTLDGNEISVTVSTGIAIFPTDGSDIETVLKNADVAMYKAKSLGKNNFQYYNLTMNTTALERLTMESDLRKALRNDELEVHYQPFINLETGALVGAEALLRWRHPQQGLIPPLKFIPIAEEIGMIFELGDRVFESVERHVVRWRRAGWEDLSVSVNISPRQLSQSSLADAVRSLLDRSNLAPRNLILEITESGVINNLDEARRTLQSLRQIGVRVALDDFGAGYSSFVLLRQIPFDFLKIDYSLIKNIVASQSDATIVASFIAIGRSLGVGVIAEGIETEEQLTFLKEKGCNLGQGFLFSEPLPEEELLKKYGR